ncbi:MAG: 3-phosphoglycerate dehydrogenase [Patescibacteria group bacterium]|nr:3-phosphoglycerate dehydrogenase [Patescibacteria group bacterium]
MQTYLIFDFDSTFVSLEGLDELARITLRDVPDRAERLARIEELTRDSMEGRLGFETSLQRRLALFVPRDEHIAETVALLKDRVTPSFTRNRALLESRAESVYIISGGFRELIIPVVNSFGIAPERVLANTFVRDAQGTVTGCDMDNFCAQNEGKVKQLRALGLDGRVVMVGDGHTDYQARAAGVADMFVAFTENVERPGIVERADAVARSLSEVLAAVGLTDGLEAGIVAK